MAGSGFVRAAAATWRSSAVVSAFCLCLLMAARSRGQLEISAPVNLSIKSHDFRTILKWDVHNSSEGTRFNVDFRDYTNAKWRPVCVNVLTHYCDLSNAFVVSEGQLGYYARVKAVTASQESKFALTNRFTFTQNASLGAPVVLLAADGSRLRVAVKYPPLNSTSDSMLLENLCYNVYCRHPNQSSPVCLYLSPAKPTFERDDVEGTVCVSAEVELLHINLIGKKSHETCLRMSQGNYSDSAILTWLHPQECENYTDDPNDDYYEDFEDYVGQDDDGNDTHPTISSIKDPENTVAGKAVISITVVVVLLIIFLSVVIYLWKCKKKLVLPKSLAHVIVKERPYNVMSSRHEESSVCVVVKPKEVTSKPDDPEHFRVPEETSISSDTVDPSSTLIVGGSSEHVNADLNDPYAGKINIGIMDQNCDSTSHVDQEAGSDQESSHDLSKTHCDSIKLSPIADNWGYDKPHVPLDMI